MVPLNGGHRREAAPVGRIDDERVDPGERIAGAADVQVGDLSDRPTAGSVFDDGLTPDDLRHESVVEAHVAHPLPPA